jgi:F1F0 ATPase subunit 2
VNELLALIASAIFGGLLGLVFFWGLWATVRRLNEARHPAIWMLGSLLLRFGFILAGFLLLTRYGGWEHLLIAAAGFTLPRIFIAHRMQTTQIHEESKP